jgi:hypothetical protein
VQKFCWKVCSTFKILHDLSSNRRKPGWFLSPKLHGAFLVRKDHKAKNSLNLKNKIKLIKLVSV